MSRSKTDYRLFREQQSLLFNNSTGPIFVSLDSAASSVTLNHTVLSRAIVGVSAGAIYSLCANWAAIAGFLTLTLLPLSVKFLMVGEEEGTILECNEVFAGIIGASAATLAGWNMLSSLKNERLKIALEQSLKNGKGYFEGEYNNQQGKSSPVRIYLKATRTSRDTTPGGIGILEDFTERRFFQQKIEHQATFDSLTGLPNRRQLQKQLERELSRAIRHRQNGALLLMDLDNFKTINDSLGHRAGDAILKQVSERLTNSLRKEDITARMGGDEFVVLLPQLGHTMKVAAQRSRDIAEKLTHTLTAPFLFDGQLLNITPSIGISLFPEQHKGTEDILKLANNQTIAVNISPREFSTSDFVDRIVRTLEETGVDPQHLDIELTEGGLIFSVSDTINKMKALRDHGIKFSIDDFGTGYSSLSYLKSLPLHTLKIDKSFVSDIGSTDHEVTLVEIIITMALSLGLEVVAEGIETLQELNYLDSKGCQVYQGYYFCKPVSPMEFRKLLKQGSVAEKIAVVAGAGHFAEKE